jgi:hypothetical protein
VVNVFVSNDFGDLLRNKNYGLDEVSGLVLRDYKISSDLRTKMFLGQFKILRYLRLALPSGAPPEAKCSEPHAREEAEALYAKSQFKREYEDYLNNDEVKNLFSDSQDPLSIVPNAKASLLAKRLMAGVLVRINQTAQEHVATLLVSIEPSAQDIVGSQYRRLDMLSGLRPAYAHEHRRIDLHRTRYSVRQSVRRLQ